jgi:hypothetical protein
VSRIFKEPLEQSSSPALGTLDRCSPSVNNFAENKISVVLADASSNNKGGGGLMKASRVQHIACHLVSKR